MDDKFTRLTRLFKLQFVVLLFGIFNMASSAFSMGGYFPQITFSANPATIDSGESSVLTWEVIDINNATTEINIDQGIGQVGFSGSLTVTPSATTYYTITTTNGNEEFVSTYATVTVTEVNTPPVAENLSITTTKDTAMAITLTATDADGDDLNYSIVSAPVNGQINGDDGDAHISYTPDSGFTGTDTFSFKANDGLDDSEAAFVTVTVNSTPSAEPTVTLAASPSTVSVGGTVTLAWDFSNADNGYIDQGINAAIHLRRHRCRPGAYHHLYSVGFWTQWRRKRPSDGKSAGRPGASTGRFLWEKV